MELIRPAPAAAAPDPKDRATPKTALAAMIV
jgi:hypothetical protein